MCKSQWRTGPPLMGDIRPREREREGGRKIEMGQS